MEDFKLLFVGNENYQRFDNKKKATKFDGSLNISQDAKTAATDHSFGPEHFYKNKPNWHFK
jgi:hypothetical protein